MDTRDKCVSQNLMALTCLLNGQFNGDFDKFMRDFGSGAAKNLEELQGYAKACEALIRVQESGDQEMIAKMQSKFDNQRKRLFNVVRAIENES